MEQQQQYNVTVIGIGAMGGGMARALLDSPRIATVTGYDRSTTLVEALHAEAVSKGKALSDQPVTCLAQAITSATHFVILVLLNEQQCQDVCFGGTKTNENVLALVPHECCVISCATVTAAWVRQAHQRFQQELNHIDKRKIYFLDCPTSGGPVRARQGDLTLMVAGDDDSLVRSSHLLVLGILGRSNEVHCIRGGVGMASTVKLVHQLLAGVHICAAAEALALAAAAGCNVQQVYDIVIHAAGASWMFQDRGLRMMRPAPLLLPVRPLSDTDVTSTSTSSSSSGPPPVKSALDIFVKDLDIVEGEAQKLKSPIPLAHAALQQFKNGQRLGLGLQDDSQVVQVYEQVTGQLVQHQITTSSSTTAVRYDGYTNAGDTDVNKYWIMEDGTKEEIVEVGSEPRHKVVLHNEYIRAMRVSFPPNDTTLAHRHAEDSLYFFLVDDGDNASHLNNSGSGTPPLQVVNHIQGSAPSCDCMAFGEVRYGTHKTDPQPLVHKITNRSSRDMLCIDAEVLQQPPVTAVIPLMADKHELVKTRDKCRVYKLTLEPGESVTVSYPFFHCSVVLKPGRVEKVTGGCIRWIETSTLGDVAWKEPVVNVTKTNVGTSVFVEFIAEWR